MRKKSKDRVRRGKSERRKIGKLIFREVLELYVIPRREYITRKSLGQHKLVKHDILERISDFARDNDVVIEIGGGEGNLTELLAERSALVISFEPDMRYFELLEKKLSFGVAVCGDFLMFDLSDLPCLVDGELSGDFKVSLRGEPAKIKDIIRRQGDRVKIVSNIPFYISSNVVHKVALESYLLSSVHLLVQREFARKLIAHPGTSLYSAISCMTQFFFSVRIEFDIPPFFFRPKPKVFASFISLYPKRVNVEKFGRDKEVIAKFIDFIYKVFRRRRRQIDGTRAYMLSPEEVFALFEKHF